MKRGLLIALVMALVAGGAWAQVGESLTEVTEWAIVTYKNAVKAANDLSRVKPRSMEGEKTFDGSKSGVYESRARIVLVEGKYAVEYDFVCGGARELFSVEIKSPKMPEYKADLEKIIRKGAKKQLQVEWAGSFDLWKTLGNLARTGEEASATLREGGK